MCGITGMFNTSKKTYIRNADKALLDMMWANQLRGVHGAGIFIQRKNGDTGVLRVAANFEYLATDKAFKKVENNLDSMSVVINHNRWATQGKIDNAHTHPFVEGPITLVHNGSLSYYPKNAKTLMDSHAITQMLAEGSVQDMVNDVMGAYSLVWKDKRDNTINFLRNEERPMWFVPIKDEDGSFFFGSEPYMIKMAMARHGLSWVEDGVKSTPVHTHLKFTVGNPVPEVAEVKKPSSGKSGTKTSKHTSRTSDTAEATPLREVMSEKWALEHKVIKNEPAVDFEVVEVPQPKKPSPPELPSYTSVNTRRRGSVVPLLPEKHPGTLLTTQSSSTSSPAFSNSNRKRKVQPILDPKSTGLPFRVGMELAFAYYSSVDHSAEGRGPQTLITGSLPAPFGPATCIVEGMIALPEGDVMKLDCMFKGTITGMARETKDSATPGRLILFLRDIQRTAMKDESCRTKWELSQTKKVAPIYAPSHLIDYKHIGKCDECGGNYHKHHLISSRNPEYFGTFYLDLPEKHYCINCLEEDLGKIVEDLDYEENRHLPVSASK